MSKSVHFNRKSTRSAPKYKNYCLEEEYWVSQSQRQTPRNSSRKLQSIPMFQKKQLKPVVNNRDKKKLGNFLDQLNTWLENSLGCENFRRITRPPLVPQLFSMGNIADQIQTMRLLLKSIFFKFCKSQDIANSPNVKISQREIIQKQFDEHQKLKNAEGDVVKLSDTILRKNNEIDILSEQLSKLCFEKEKLEKNLKINDDVVRFIVDLIRNQNLGQNVECSDGKIKENLNECKELVYDLIHNLKVKQEQIDSFELKIQKEKDNSQIVIQEYQNRIQDAKSHTDEIRSQLAQKCQTVYELEQKVQNLQFQIIRDQEQHDFKKDFGIQEKSNNAVIVKSLKLLYLLYKKHQDSKINLQIYKQITLALQQDLKETLNLFQIPVNNTAIKVNKFKSCAQCIIFIHKLNFFKQFPRVKFKGISLTDYVEDPNLPFSPPTNPDCDLIGNYLIYLDTRLQLHNANYYNSLAKQQSHIFRQIFTSLHSYFDTIHLGQDKFKENYNIAIDSISKKEDQLRNLRKQHSKLTETYQYLHQNYDILNQQIQDQAQVLKQTQASLAACESKYDQLSVKYQQLVEKHEKVAAQSQEAEKECARSHTSIQNLEHQQQRLKTLLQASESALKAANDALNLRTQSFLREISVLQQKIHKQQTNFEESPQIRKPFRTISQLSSDFTFQQNSNEFSLADSDSFSPSNIRIEENAETHRAFQNNWQANYNMQRNIFEYLNSELARVTGSNDQPSPLRQRIYAKVGQNQPERRKLLYQPERDMGLQKLYQKNKETRQQVKAGQMKQESNYPDIEQISEAWNRLKDERAKLRQEMHQIQNKDALNPNRFISQHLQQKIADYRIEKPTKDFFHDQFSRDSPCPNSNRTPIHIYDRNPSSSGLNKFQFEDTESDYQLSQDEEDYKPKLTIQKSDDVKFEISDEEDNFFEFYPVGQKKLTIQNQPTSINIPKTNLQLPRKRSTSISQNRSVTPSKRQINHSDSVSIIQKTQPSETTSPTNKSPIKSMSNSQLIKTQSRSPSAQLSPKREQPIQQIIQPIIYHQPYQPPPYYPIYHQPMHYQHVMPLIPPSYPRVDSKQYLRRSQQYQPYPQELDIKSFSSPKHNQIKKKPKSSSVSPSPKHTPIKIQLTEPDEKKEVIEFKAEEEIVEQKVPVQDSLVWDIQVSQENKKISDAFLQRRQKAAAAKQVKQEKTKEELIQIRKDMMKKRVPNKPQKVEQKPEIIEIEKPQGKEPSRELLHRLAMGIPPKVSQKEAKELSARRYKKLPEMVKRDEEAKKKEEMMSRMQKAKEYEKVSYIQKLRDYNRNKLR